MDRTDWILCPVCTSKTRIKIREDTILENFPLFCPKCKQETIIAVQKLNISVSKVPDKQSADRYGVSAPRNQNSGL